MDVCGRTNETKIDFDPAGDQTYLQDADGNTTTFVYDRYGRLTAERINLASPGSAAPKEARTYDYDAGGRLWKYTDRDGRKIETKYDALDRPVLQQAFDVGGALASEIHWEYNQDGTLKLVRNGDVVSGVYAGDTAKYEYLDYDERARVKIMQQTLAPFGATPLVIRFNYNYLDTLPGPSSAYGTAKYGYSVTAAEVIIDGAFTSLSTLYTNVYRFDAAGREVYASQDVDDTFNDKLVTRSYDINSAVPFTSRYDILERMQDGHAVAKSTTYYESENSNLVRQVSHVKPDDTEITTHQYLYDIKDDLRRYKVTRQGNTGTWLKLKDPPAEPPPAPPLPLRTIASPRSTTSSRTFSTTPKETSSTTKMRPESTPIMISPGTRMAG